MAGSIILIVDDEESVRKSLADVMRDEGYEVVTAASGREGVELLQETHPALALLDIAMPDMDGVETLRRFRELRPDMPVVMITGHGTIETAVKTVKMGAYDFIQKPPELQHLHLVVKHGLDESRLREENETLRRSVERKSELVGESGSIATLKQQIALAGPTNGWVLIHGESGTGKELVARAIHRASKRAGGPFVEVNCAAIPQELIESELFGHEKGSFTGATGMKRGRFELADQGTIFLDEIADMSTATQAKVLRVLEGGEFQRVGGVKTLKADVRVVAASNKVLADEIRKGTFREDLYYRLNVIPLDVPPLRERSEDIPLLVRHFLAEFSAEYGQKVKAVDDEALASFVRYPWPGNVRELRNVIERLIIMVPRPVITIRDVPPSLLGAREERREKEPSSPHAMRIETLKAARAEFEREFIIRKLREFGGNISRTADAIAVERSNLHRKIKALGIEADD
jgi:two-component system, NtrC family, nitrogen regulation response regulator NtrX